MELGGQAQGNDLEGISGEYRQGIGKAMENIQNQLAIVSTDSMALPNNNPKAIRIDLGCGDRKRTDFPFIGIDSCSSPGVDIIRDIRKGLPFCDNSIDLVYASHYIEHVTDLVFLVEEIWRVLKRGGILEIICPKWDTQFALCDPTHVRFIHPVLWDWWKLKRKEKKAYGAKAQFQVLKCETKEKEAVVLGTLAAIKPSFNFQADMGIRATDSTATSLASPSCIKVDLGCGNRKRNDFPVFIGIDQHPYSCVDIVRDVEKQGMPFCDCSIDFIYASHFMEHVDDLIFVMDEIWRVLKRDGIVELICPKFDTVYAYAHPDHKRFIHAGLWGWWRQENEEKESYGAKASFKLLKNYEEGEGLFTTMMAVK